MKEIELTIFCHNIWGDFRKNDAIANRNECIAELADYYDADLLAFQECNPKTSRADECDIAKMLSRLNYTEVYTEAGKNNFTPIFYKNDKYNLVESGYEVLAAGNDRGAKSLTYAVLEEHAERVRFGIVCAHFWYASRNDLDTLMRLDNARALLECVKRIENKYNIPVFAMGDFNSGDGAIQGTLPYTYLKQSLLDTREIAPISSDTPTHHALPKRNYEGLYFAEISEPDCTLDHIFVTQSERVAIDEFLVDTSDTAYTASDHFPIVLGARVFGGGNE